MPTARRPFPPAGHPSAFSLMELLVVLGVIMILFAMAFPMINAAIARGKSAECQNNLRQWGLALGMYLDDSGGVFPTDGSGAGGNVADPRNTNAWFNLLPPYVQQPTMIELERAGTIRVPGTGKSLYICPSSPAERDLLADYSRKTSAGASQRTYYNSYAYNWWIDNVKPGRPDLGTLLRLSQIRTPSLFVVFADSPTGYWRGGEMGGALPGYRYSKTHPTAMAESEHGNAFRHAGRANVCFADGHVRTFRTRDIWFSGMTTQHNYGGIQWNPMNDNLRGGF